MPQKWTVQEEKDRRAELIDLYVNQNKTIKEIGNILGIAESTVFGRMTRLNISSNPQNKLTYCNKRRKDLNFPDFSEKLAELSGILLGDGHISLCPGQMFVCINRITDKDYIIYTRDLLKNLFGVEPSCHKRKSKPVVDLFISSVDLIEYLSKIGLSASNKVKKQVDVPAWIKEDSSYKKAFLRGFFDTDGSIYKLKFGIQMAFCNKSIPLLESTQKMLLGLDYHPSKISSFKIYLTKRPDLGRYIQEIGFGNAKHYNRALEFGIIKKGA